MNPRKNNTITGWRVRDYPGQKGDQLTVLLSFSLCLMLSKSVRFQQVEISLHCANENAFISCSDHVLEFPKQASFVNQPE